MKKLSKILCILLVAVLALSFAACGKETTPEQETLATPANVTVSDDGLITWDAVENATEYIVIINGEERVVSATYYQAASADDFTFSVKARGEGYADSAASSQQSFTGKGNPVPAPPESTVAVAISGSSEVGSGMSIKLTASVTGADDKTVAWSIGDGKEYATIDGNGNLTANEVSGDKVIKVVATSNEDPTVSATKVVTILAKPVLTQAMLDALDDDYLSFDGYISINVYTFGILEKLYSTYTVDGIKTAMDGTNWYAEYDNTGTGVVSSMFYKNHNGLACRVGVSFMNEEEYTPMLDGEEQVSWTDAGLYNNFKGLTLSDFTFNESTWRYEYSGSDQNLPAKMVASANPYDFTATGFALIIDSGEIMGVYAESAPDYTLVTGYKSIQELYVFINCGEDFVTVPTVTKYEHDEKHDALNTAIENMRALDSYKTDFREITYSIFTTSYAESGYVETVTAEDCYFQPYTVSYIGYEEQYDFIRDGEYGFKKISDDLYNAYYYNSDIKGYEANRAYAADFSNAKPSFAFAAEIFTGIYEDEDGSVTYYVDDIMSPVASTWYYGMGNDINLYGLFATRGYTSETSSFTPFVTVKDGYITEACFYFYIGSIYGVIEIEYSDFNQAQLPEGTEISFETRQIPVSWDELTIIVSDDTSSTADDEEMNALTYLKQFFGDEDIAEKMPFFGLPLGDAYGFGLTTTYMPGGSNILHRAIVFYYDVPLDIDYTIESSLTAVQEYLVSLGFEKNSYGEYIKGDIAVIPTDTNLDFMIYVWKVN